MKKFSMTIILISALAITLMTTAIFNGIQQVSAQEDNKKQVNTERQQLNKCEINLQNEERKLECANVMVYGVVCMPGSVCKLESYDDVPFELVTPQ
jgi:hypothetical protein